MAKSNVTNVQVPGDEPAVDEVEQPAQAEAVSEPEAALTAPEAEEKLPVTRGSYRNMRAADIDATKLTAPVMTLDGWLCPPAQVKK